MLKFLFAALMFLLALAIAGPLGALLMIICLALLAGGMWFLGDLMKIGRDWADLIREHRARNQA